MEHPKHGRERQPELRAMAFNWGWFCPPGSLDNVVTTVGRGCSWAARAQGCRYTSYNAQDNPRKLLSGPKRQ